MDGWQKSTYSSSGACVETKVTWQKSTWSGNGGNCVEVGVSWS